MSSGIDFGFLCPSPESGEISFSPSEGRAINGKKGNPFAEILGALAEVGTGKETPVRKAEVVRSSDLDREVNGGVLSWNVFSIAPSPAVNEEESMASVPQTLSGFASEVNSGKLLNLENLPEKGEGAMVEAESVTSIPQTFSEFDSGKNSGELLKSENLPEKGEGAMAEEKSVTSIPQTLSEFDSGKNFGELLKSGNLPEKEGYEVPSSSFVVQDTAEKDLAGVSVAAEEALPMAKDVRKGSIPLAEVGEGSQILDDDLEESKCPETASARENSPQDDMALFRHVTSEVEKKFVSDGHDENSFSQLSSRSEDTEKDSLAYQLDKKELFKNISEESGEVRRDEQECIHQGEFLTSRGVSSAEGSVRTVSVPLLSTGSSALGEGIVNVVKVIRSDGEHRARIIIEPPALGRIEVELRTTSNGLEASLRVDNSQLKDLLQSQVSLLRSSLEEQGIALAGMEVDVRGDDDQRRKGQFFSSRKIRRGNSEADSEETLSIARIDLERGLLSWTA